MDPDAALMLRVKDGDIHAFEELVQKYKHPIVNVIYRMLHDLDEAEDLAQNVFVRVFQSASRYEVSAKFSTWIFTIARHLCLNEIRRRGRHPAQSLEASQSEDEEQAPRQYPDLKTASPPQAFLHRELEQKIQEAVAELPDKQRLAIAGFHGDLQLVRLAHVADGDPLVYKVDSRQQWVVIHFVGALELADDLT